MSRKSHVYLFSFAASVCISAVGCSGSNDPATPAGGAGTPSGAAGSTSGVAGSASAGAPAASAGASSVAGATNAAGSASGGAPASAGASGSAPAAGSGNTAGSTSGGTFDPLCSAVPATAAGAAPTKGGACTPTDAQLCYKTCGPQGVGYKSETCVAGVYQEQSGCSFPDQGDYACFKIPATQDATCPTTTITASTPCTVTACTTCTDATKHYYDSQMNLKTGYCVCPMSTSGMSKWSCASDTAWPCPTGKGC